jgi:hypothetical protein
MYSSLDRIDILAEGDSGVLAVQTDHRPRAEIEDEPELSTLFALIRVLNARRILADQERTIEAVVYVALDDPPPFLLEALGSVEATIERTPARIREALQPGDQPAEEIADRAFAALAARVGRRVGLSDPAAALRALEAELCASPPDREEDETGYWRGVLELAALAVTVIRNQHPGRWTRVDQGEVPFGFALDGDSGVVLPANRAQRLIEDGEGESMFLLVGSIAEIVARRDGDGAAGPLLPSLRHPSEVASAELLARRLLTIEQGAADLPLIAYGEDSESTFSLLQHDRHAERADAIHDEAMANIRAQPAEAEEIEVDGVRLIAVSGGFFAAEKLLDRDFMRELATRLDADLLAVATPRRGLMFATSAAQEMQKIGVLAAIAEHEFEQGGGRSISASILLVRDGEVVGMAAPGEDDDGDGGGDDDDRATD